MQTQVSRDPTVLYSPLLQQRAHGAVQRTDLYGSGAASKSPAVWRAAPPIGRDQPTIEPRGRATHNARHRDRLPLAPPPSRGLGDLGPGRLVRIGLAGVRRFGVPNAAPPAVQMRKHRLPLRVGPSGPRAQEAPTRASHSSSRTRHCFQHGMWSPERPPHPDMSSTTASCTTILLDLPPESSVPTAVCHRTAPDRTTIRHIGCAARMEGDRCRVASPRSSRSWAALEAGSAVRCSGPRWRVT